ncbi:oxidoreductase [Aureococcus anophagefferens]|nr:oxidoreductase [Aureococcus anophagefferens]
MAKRHYDLVLFGCTGDAGRAVAAFFGKHAGGTTWALAGRNAKKLEALRASDAALARVPLVVADVGDAASMDAMARSCDLVVSAAGPYALLGEAVVRACVDRGTHYLGATGEVHWVAEMATKYAGAATASCLASFGGYDCVPDEATIPVVHRSPRRRRVLDAFRFKDRMVLPGARALLTGKGALSYYAFVAFLFVATPAFLVLAVLVRAPPVERAARRLLEARSYGGSRAAGRRHNDDGPRSAGASATATLRVRGDAGIVATAALCGESRWPWSRPRRRAQARASRRRRRCQRRSARLEQSETMSLVVAKAA